MAQTVKRLPPMWETWVRSLGREDSLEKEMATHSSTLAWKIPWTERSLVNYSPRVRKELGTTMRRHFSHPYMNTGKSIALTRQTIVDKVISLLFNMLSRLFIAFLPRSKLGVTIGSIV